MNDKEVKSLWNDVLVFLLMAAFLGIAFVLMYMWTIGNQ